MKTSPLIGFILALGRAGIALTGCGKKRGESDTVRRGKERGEKEGGRGHVEEAPSGAFFERGKGVILTDETRQSLGLETAEATKRKVPLELVVTKPVEKLWLIELRATKGGADSR